jgi:tetrapyrrole methylase family protein / MazG family protein
MSPGITIVGLGPGDEATLTLSAWETLSQAGEIYLRTERHPTVSHLPQHLRVHSFDSIYEQLGSFAQVYEEIAQRVVELGARPEGVVYAVPGHPLVGETSVQRILELAPQRELEVRFVSGVSFLEPALEALGLDAMDGLQIADGTAIGQQHHPWLNPDIPAVIAQVYDRRVASDVKLTLMNQYHDDHPVVVIQAAGTPHQSVRHIRLYELDWQTDLDHLTSLFVPPTPQQSSVAAFHDVLARLRAPNGCPWDREQTHQSLQSNLVEETYEVLEAIDADSAPDLCEELGDLLLQIMLHAQIATEEGSFKAIDVLEAITAKMRRRHPHVFRDGQASDTQEVLRNWEEIKRAERDDPSKSLLDGLPAGLPALSQAFALQDRAHRVGFDWESPEPVLAKVTEELDELRDAKDPETRAREFGDLLFSLVNAARWLDIDPESALRRANQRFASRFRQIEQAAAASGRAIEEMSLIEMDALWEQAKAEEATPTQPESPDAKEGTPHA